MISQLWPRKCPGMLCSAHHWTFQNHPNEQTKSSQINPNPNPNLLPQIFLTSSRPPPSLHKQVTMSSSSLSDWSTEPSTDHEDFPTTVIFLRPLLKECATLLHDIHKKLELHGHRGVAIIAPLSNPIKKRIGKDLVVIHRMVCCSPTLYPVCLAR